MPNTNATVNSAIIAQTALTSLLAKFPILARIATDFSASSVKFNQDIVTHIVTPTVARDFDQATGYVPDDQAQVDVPVKIDKHAYAGYAITDVERSTSQIDLNQRYADKVAYALGRKVCDDLMALIVTANFPNESAVAEANFKRDSVVDIGTKLNKRFIPDMGRFMFLNSDYYNALQKDEALYKAYITPAASNVVVSGVLPDVNGFTVIEYSALPENAENLVGFAGIREGLIMAARVPDVPQKSRTGPHANVTRREPAQIVTSRKALDNYIARTQRKVGFAKGVWIKAAKAIGGLVRGGAQWATRHRKAPGSATVKTGIKPSVTLISRLDYMDDVLSEASVRLAMEVAAGRLRCALAISLRKVADRTNRGRKRRAG